MNPPVNSQDSSSAVAPPTSPVKSAVQNPILRSTGVQAGAAPIGPARDARNVAGDPSNAAKGAESPKGSGHGSTSPQGHGGGGLRQAVQELAASVKCLCAESGARGSSDAKTHLEQAQRLLAGLSRGTDPRSTPESCSPASGAPAARTGAADDDIQQDLQRAMR